MKRLRWVKTFLKFILLLKKLNWCKTIQINFSCLPISTAIKFPIFVYGKAKFYSLRGDIIIRGKITTGMIKFGRNTDNHFASNLPIQLTLNKNLIFNGKVIFSGGVTLETYLADIEFGHCCIISSGVMVKSESGIFIGESTRIAYCSVVMDTNVHFLHNIKNDIISNSTGPIYIGKRCWLNPNTIVAKNTILPDFCVTTRDTLLNKDYSKICGEYSLLSGTPAKCLLQGIRRIYSNRSEKYIRNVFHNQDVNEISKFPSELSYEDDVNEIEPLFDLWY